MITLCVLFLFGKCNYLSGDVRTCSKLPETVISLLALQTPSTEHLGAIARHLRHSFNSDSWVITMHTEKSYSFRFLISQISSGPVASPEEKVNGLFREGGQAEFTL